MLEIEQNWGEIANYFPQCSTKIGTTANRPVGRAVTRLLVEREVWGPKIGQVKLYRALLTARIRTDVFSKAAVLPGAMTRRWAMPTRCTLQRNSATLMNDFIWKFSEYNERFIKKTLIKMFIFEAFRLTLVKKNRQNGERRKMSGYL